MIVAVFLHVLLLCQASLVGQLSAGPLAPELSSSPPVATSRPAEGVPSSQPAAQTTGSQQSEQNTSKVGFVDVMSHTTLGQMVQGQRSLTWDDIRQPWFWVGVIQNLGEAIIIFVPRLVGTLVFLFFFWLVYRGIRRMALSSMKRAQVDQSIQDMISALIRWTVMLFGIVIACNQLGIPIVAMLTGVSIVGLAVGFAAQETLANFIAGIVIFMDKPFRIGDWIEIDGDLGKVQRVTFRSTRVLNLDGEILVLPNTHMLSNKLINHSSHPVQRVNVRIGIAYKESIDRAREVILAVVKGDPRLCDAPAPSVIVDQCADSSVNLILRFWIRDESQEPSIVAEYLEKAKKALDAAGIEIPFPHMQLFLEGTPAVSELATGGKDAALAAARSN